ncbi:MAG: glycoside hydrolase family 3 C-terminal domain-containing protein [Bacteroidales bacterium]|nr:glycoside hydrolase family 3 C-terminal domain-containing protein [Bacteroidales bacterium]
MNPKKILPVISIFFLMFLTPACQTNKYPFLNPDLSVDKRVDDLVGRMTLEEKISQMQSHAAAIPRLGIPEYHWWSECLHGVARNKVATVFPQAIAMAATWDPELIRKEADVVATEARAKHHEDVRNGKHGRYQGLTFWSPNVNLFRDPRWGRGQETYGEDPFLESRIGVAFVQGLQGDDPKYFKVIATPKHFVVHSGPEPLRHGFNAVTSDRDFYESYLPAFRATVSEGGAYSVMGAYSAYKGVPCNASHYLLDTILRQQLGFKGYVVSDCGAIRDIMSGHKKANSLEEASAMAVKAGCDLDCGNEYGSLKKAVEQGLISEKEIDVAVKRLMKARFLLGMFDPPEKVKYAQIPYSLNDTPEHRKLAAEVARKSMVLLKNENHILPLSKAIHTLAVVGPYADNMDVLLGNYHGTPSHAVNFLEGIKKEAQSRGMNVLWAKGVEPIEKLAGKKKNKNAEKAASDIEKNRDALIRQAVDDVRKADVAVVVVGISPRLEGEEMPIKMEGFQGGDRTSLKLPAPYEKLLKTVYATGKPVVLVLTGGSALAVNWAEEHVPAILMAWYPGEEGGTALADILFGKYNPAGRLPVTFYRSVNDLPPFTDYFMKGRTYRFFTGKPLYPFGYGLSYTSFDYTGLSLSKTETVTGDTINVQIAVKNTGDYDGEEVVQLYVRNPADRNGPRRSLKGFSRVFLKKGEDKVVNIPLAINNLAIYHPGEESFGTDPGNYELLVGSSSEDLRLKKNLSVK